MEEALRVGWGRKSEHAARNTRASMVCARTVCARTVCARTVCTRTAVWLHTRTAVCLSVWLHARLSICLSVCLSVWLAAHTHGWLAGWLARSWTPHLDSEIDHRRAAH